MLFRSIFMFGMSFAEILIIAIIAVLVLGPDKLPSTLVKIAKFFKSFKSTINDAKSSFEQEIKIAELKEDAQKYKAQLESGTQEIRKKLTLEELDELKSAKNSVNETINSIKNDLDISSSLNQPFEDIKNDLDITKNLNPLNETSPKKSIE